jgi:anti-sigma factor RsiW
MNGAMTCGEASALAVAYADGELDGLRADSIREHLATCADCAAASEAVFALRERIRADVPAYRAPAALRARVVAAAGTAVQSSSAPRGRWRWLFTGALGGCAATVLAWVVGTTIMDWRAQKDLAVEVVAAHVRATLGNHRVDVASSDQHTVKPWLSARLDYSPPVRDFAATGFVLVGGRLDYLDGQPVATLVYRYRDHVVDVFVRPQSSRAAGTALRTLRGFNVARAADAAMEWVAVSDVSADVLSAFVRQLSKQD